MNDLLSAIRVSQFSQLLTAYRKAGVDLGNAIDGGAGSGSTAKQMLPLISGRVYAFEPFPGNHRFFKGIDPRIQLIPKALAETKKTMAFKVSSVVSENSLWGRQKGMVGYSSVGHLAGQNEGAGMEVECVRGDIAVPDRVGFVKLDLQGGELNALNGMARLLQDVPLMWVEYMGHEGLYDFIVNKGFMVFDTEYFFLGEPTQRTKDLFEVSREGVPLSTGKTAWFGFKRHPWQNFKEEFIRYKKELGLVQTDLACINKRHLEEFKHAIQYLNP